MNKQLTQTEINEIEVKQHQNLSNMEQSVEQSKNLDLSKLSAEELKAELDRRAAKKDEDREAYKKLVEEATPKAIYKLAEASSVLQNAKTEIFKYFKEVLELKQQVYGVRDKQQTHTFSCRGGEVTIGFRINDGWDDTVNAGISKVEKFISSLAKDEDTAHLVSMVFNLLKKDAKGNLKGSRVLELQKMTKQFNNEEFTDGVNIIAAAYKPVKSVWFIEGATTNENGEKTPIGLSMSSVPFNTGFEFDFLQDESNS